MRMSVISWSVQRVSPASGGSAIGGLACLRHAFEPDVMVAD